MRVIRSGCGSPASASRAAAAPHQTISKTMETEANEGNEVEPSPLGVKAEKRTFVAFVIFCARTSLAGYQVRGFHAFPAQWEAVSQAQSNQFKPAGLNQGSLQLVMKLALTLSLHREREWIDEALRESDHLRPNPTISDQFQPGRCGKHKKNQGFAGVRTNYGRPALRAAQPSRRQPVKPSQTLCDAA
jgi:hypothetical protein